MTDDLSDYVGTWGWYPLFPTFASDPNVHPDDLASFAAIDPNFKIFHCTGVDGDWLVITYDGSERYRIRPGRFAVVPRPAFSLGEKVIVQGDNELEGTVEDIIWYHRHHTAKFLIAFDNKTEPEWCYPEELRPFDENSVAPHLSSTLGGLLLRCLLRGLPWSANGTVHLQGDYPWHADSLCLIYSGDPDLETAHPEFVAENNIKGALSLDATDQIACVAGQQKPDVTVEELVVAFNHYYVHDGFLWYQDETFA